MHYTCNHSYVRASNVLLVKLHYLTFEPTLKSKKIYSDNSIIFPAILQLIDVNLSGCNAMDNLL